MRRPRSCSGPQRVVRAPPVVAAARARIAAGRDRAARHRRVDRDGDRPGHRRAARLGFYATGIVGVRAVEPRDARRRARPRRRSTIRRCSVSTRPQRPRSSRCSRRGCVAATWIVAGRRDGVALVLTPFVPAGVPVLCAALVAVIVGWRAPLMWAAIVAGSFGCYALKLAGLSVPSACSTTRASSASRSSCRSRCSPRSSAPRRSPPAATSRSTRGSRACSSPSLLVWRRAPFLVVVFAAAATAALLAPPREPDHLIGADAPPRRPIRHEMVSCARRTSAGLVFGRRMATMARWPTDPG